MDDADKKLLEENDEVAWKVATVISYSPTGLNGNTYDNLAHVVAHIILDDAMGKKLVADYKKKKSKI